MNARSAIPLGASFFLLAVLSSALHAATRIESPAVPDEMRSGFFSVTVNNKRIDTAKAASNYDFVNFGVNGPAEVTITAAEPGFWDHGVDIQPWRLGLRATRDGQTIRFRIPGPVKLSIGRPADFLNQARMLFLFAGNLTPLPPPAQNVTIIPAGIHRQSLNPKSGDIIYMEPGSYVFGSLNLLQVHNVKILGRGTIVHDGPQDPRADEGWMQKPDWHCIGAYNSSNIEIDGLTCIVRSRTWSVQMKDSTGLLFDDLRIIGGNPGNANQDGLDWLGGGDAIVRNAFLRTSDDDFAVLGNFDGYTQEDLTRPGADVRNIVIENSELSTSISNVVRIGWPQKIFNSTGFTLRNSDILHAGIGACGQSFGILGMWGAKDARGDHSQILFENLTIDDWYSLAQVEQEQPAIHGLTFRNIWALGQPPLEASSLTGNVRDVSFDNVKVATSRATQAADLPIEISGGAQAPTFAPPPPLVAEFTVSPAVINKNTNVIFSARAFKGAQYTWLFGDGTEAHGARVRHRFPDSLGTSLDGANGAGRFRVLLHVIDRDGHQDWASRSVVVTDTLHESEKPAGETQPGLRWNIYAGGWADLPDFTKLEPVLTGASLSLQADAQGFTHWATVWEGALDVPSDGGYTFHLIDRDGARVVIDGAEIARTGPPFAQVCGSPGNAQRYRYGAIGLRAGTHSIRVEALNTSSGGAPRLMWEGPGIELHDVPAAAYSAQK